MLIAPLFLRAWLFLLVSFTVGFLGFLSCLPWSATFRSRRFIIFFVLRAIGPILITIGTFFMFFFAYLILFVGCYFILVVGWVDSWALFIFNAAWGHGAGLLFVWPLFAFNPHHWFLFLVFTLFSWKFVNFCQIYFIFRVIFLSVPFFHHFEF